MEMLLGTTGCLAWVARLAVVTKHARHAPDHCWHCRALERRRDYFFQIDVGQPVAMGLPVAK